MTNTETLQLLASHIAALERWAWGSARPSVLDDLRAVPATKDHPQELIGDLAEALRDSIIRLEDHAPTHCSSCTKAIQEGRALIARYDAAQRQVPE